MVFLLKFAVQSSTIMVAAFSFKMSAASAREYGYISTNKKCTRGDTISEKSLKILGSEGRLDLKYETRDWNTMILQYFFITESGRDQRFFNE